MAVDVRRIVTVSLVVGGVGSVIGFWGVHQQLRQQYHAAVKTQQSLQTQVNEFQQEFVRMSDALVGSQQQVGELTQALSTKEAELARTVARLTQEEQVVRALEGKLASMQRHMGQLQGELAATLEQRSTEAAPVQLDRVIVTQSAATGLGLEGRVMSVHPDWKFVVIDLGWDVVKIGDVVSIYRQDQLVAKARVERVQEQVSAATVLPETTITTIQVNDAVRIL